jgi:hypothetical protein
MTRKSDLLEARESVLKFLFDAIFHGLQTTREKFNAAIHDLGTIDKLLKKRDED